MKTFYYYFRFEITWKYMVMMRYMVTPLIFWLDDDDIATYDVLVICLFLMVYQCHLSSKPNTFIGMELYIQVSLIAKYSDRFKQSASRDVFWVRVQTLCINIGNKYNTMLIRNTIHFFLLLRLVSAKYAGPISGTHLVSL